MQKLRILYLKYLFLNEIFLESTKLFGKKQKKQRENLIQTCKYEEKRK